MQEVTKKVEEFLKTNKKALIATAAIASIAALKLYCRGGINKAKRDLSGQVVVITGGNSGIGKETV